jgi:hypothetical protein
MLLDLFLCLQEEGKPVTALFEGALTCLSLIILLHPPKHLYFEQGLKEKWDTTMWHPIILIGFFKRDL